jgi:hypothetical protein
MMVGTCVADACEPSIILVQVAVESDLVNGKVG